MAEGYEPERAAIEGRFAANFTALPCKYENQRFTPPAQSAWVALTILNGEARRASIGTTTPLQRYPGIIQIDVYVPENTGTATARGHADTIASVFRDVTFTAGTTGKVVCGTPYATPLGVADGWYRIAVTVPFRRDAIH